MNLTRIPDYSRLAEMMGEGYDEENARMFRNWLISLDIYNTDEIPDNLWPKYLDRWEELYGND